MLKSKYKLKLSGTITGASLCFHFMIGYKHNFCLRRQYSAVPQVLTNNYCDCKSIVRRTLLHCKRNQPYPNPNPNPKLYLNTGGLHRNGTGTVTKYRNPT